MRGSRSERTRSAPNQESSAKAKARPTSKTAVKRLMPMTQMSTRKTFPRQKRQKFTGKSDKSKTKKRRNPKTETPDISKDCYTGC